MPKMIFLIFWGDGTNEEETKFWHLYTILTPTPKPFEARVKSVENEPLGTIMAKMSPSALLFHFCANSPKLFEARGEKWQK